MAVQDSKYKAFEIHMNRLHGDERPSYMVMNYMPKFTRIEHRSAAHALNGLAFRSSEEADRYAEAHHIKVFWRVVDGRYARDHNPYDDDSGKGKIDGEAYYLLDRAGYLYAASLTFAELVDLRTDPPGQVIAEASKYMTFQGLMNRLHDDDD